jgi:hypothetical protein
MATNASSMPLRVVFALSTLGNDVFILLTFLLTFVNFTGAPEPRRHPNAFGATPSRWMCPPFTPVETGKGHK